MSHFQDSMDQDFLLEIFGSQIHSYWKGFHDKLASQSESTPEWLLARITYNDNSWCQECLYPQCNWSGTLYILQVCTSRTEGSWHSSNHHKGLKICRKLKKLMSWWGHLGDIGGGYLDRKCTKNPHVLDFQTWWHWWFLAYCLEDRIIPDIINHHRITSFDIIDHHYIIIYDCLYVC